MTVEEFEPKYQTLEVINITSGTMQLLPLKIARYLYGDYNIISVRDYDKTKSTSIIIRRPKNDRKRVQRAN